MHKFAASFALLLLVLASAVSTCAQGGPKSADSASRVDTAKLTVHYYRLNFVLEEPDSATKPVNSRDFSMMISTSGTQSGSVVVGPKIPVIVGPQSAKDDPSGRANEFQYIDVGVKITASEAREDGGHLAFYLHTEVTSLAIPTVLAGVSEPVIRQHVWSGDILVPVGKPTVAFKSDSPESKGSIQLKVTATQAD
jgi:hypothetical protein